MAALHKKSSYPNLSENFRSLVKETRLEQSLTVRIMAKDLGIIPTTLYQLEAGQRNYNYETAVRIRDYLEMKYDLPDPAPVEGEKITRHLKRALLVENEPFCIMVDGKIIEVVTFRRLSEFKKSNVVSD